jgi:peptidoglycan/LPS O-acetylase OafA/YrhL
MGRADDSTRSTIDERRPRPFGTEEALPIMSRRKPLAALAAVTAALALAVPAASAGAATFPTTVAYTPPVYLCSLLVFQLRAAEATGNTLMANLLGQTLMDVGCGGAAI